MAMFSTMLTIVLSFLFLRTTISFSNENAYSQSNNVEKNNSEFAYMDGSFVTNYNNTEVIVDNANDYDSDEYIDGKYYNSKTQISDDIIDFIIHEVSDPYDIEVFLDLEDDILMSELGMY